MTCEDEGTSIGWLSGQQVVGLSDAATASRDLATVVSSDVIHLSREKRDIITEELAVIAGVIDLAIENQYEIVEGIEEHGTCGCGWPVIRCNDSQGTEGWHHVYNETVCGTNDHDPNNDNS